jgi:hypothetical protein
VAKVIEFYIPRTFRNKTKRAPVEQCRVVIDFDSWKGNRIEREVAQRFSRSGELVPRQAEEAVEPGNAEGTELVDVIGTVTHTNLRKTMEVSQYFRLCGER